MTSSFGDPRERAAGPRSIVAGIVAYHPEPGQLLTLVAAVGPDVGTVLVVANSPLALETERDLAEAAGAAGFDVLRPDGNVGLGEAYNCLLDRAEAAGAKFLVLLDQDSLPPAGTVPRLVDSHVRLVAAGERPVIVGPHPVMAGGAPVRLYPQRGATTMAGFRPVAFAISSGSLVSVEAARAIGPFRADFFIDAIDVEWGYRAWSRGWSVWITDDVPMPHRLGRGAITALRLTDQPAARIYTFIRNQLAMLRLPHVPLAHKARFVATLPARIAIYLARHRASPEILRAIGRALRDGIGGRLGPP